MPARAPNGIRTRVTALKGRRPRPLDDGGGCSAIIAHGDSSQLLPSGPSEAPPAYAMFPPMTKPAEVRAAPSTGLGAGPSLPPSTHAPQHRRAGMLWRRHARRGIPYRALDRKTVESG